MTEAAGVQKVWLVTGQSGSYSDQAWWPVKAFTTKEKAEAFAESLPGLYAALRKPLPIDDEKAAKVHADYVALCERSKTQISPYAKPNADFQAQMRAMEEMRVHDPGFSGGDDHAWHVEELELES